MSRCQFGMNPNVDAKVVILGCEFSGKTSLVQRFLYDRFIGENKYQSTIGAAFGARKVFIDKEQSVLLGLWDTAGSERFTSMSRMFYRGAKAAIVCYDVTNEKTWEKVEFWVKELLKYEESCKIYIVGTKTDLLSGDKKKRRVDYHNVHDYVDELSENGRRFIRTIETSAKTGENIERLFVDIARDFFDEPINRILMQHNTLTLEENRHKEKKFGCCQIL